MDLWLIMLLFFIGVALAVVGIYRMSSRPWVGIMLIILGVATAFLAISEFREGSFRNSELPSIHATYDSL